MSTLEQVREAKRRMDDADENLRAFLERTKTQPSDRARHTELVMQHTRLRGSTSGWSRTSNYLPSLRLAYEVYYP